MPPILGTTIVRDVHEHGPPAAAVPGVESVRRTTRHHWAFARIGMYLLLASLPLLAISAHVFGVVSMTATGPLVIIPLGAVLAVFCVVAPHPIDRIVGYGLGWGMFACLAYDVLRLDTVYLLGLWDDFIPHMGTWLHSGSDAQTGAIVGYLWRYLGDGGGIGIAFFLIALALGLHYRSRRTILLAFVTGAVFPVWVGLIATVALSPRGQRDMFPLTPTTISLSLIGHLIFGLVLGLGFLRARGRLGQHWPWRPLLPVRSSAGQRQPRSEPSPACGECGAAVDGNER